MLMFLLPKKHVAESLFGHRTFGEERKTGGQWSFAKKVWQPMWSFEVLQLSGAVTAVTHHSPTEGGKGGFWKQRKTVERRFGRCGSLGLDPGRHHFMSLTGLGKLEVANLFSCGSRGWRSPFETSLRWIQHISIGKKNWTCVICGCGEISMSKFFWFPQAAWWNIEGKKDWEWENGTCQSWNMREFSNKTWDTSTIPRQCPKRSGWRYRFRAFCPSAKLEVIWVAISQKFFISHFLFCFTNVFWLVSIVFMSLSTDVLRWTWPDSPTCFSLRHLNISLPSSSRWSNRNRKSWERWLQLAPVHLWHGHSDFQIGRVCRERLTFLEGKGQWGRMGWWLNLICMQMIWTLDIWPVIFLISPDLNLKFLPQENPAKMARSENCDSFVKRRR